MVQQTPEPPISRARMAGKIVKRRDLKTNMNQSNYNVDQSVNQELNETYLTNQPSNVSFQTTQTQMAQASVNVPMEKRVDLMIEKEKIKKQRLEMERELKEIQETQDCTFKPKIIGKRPKKANVVPEKYRETSPED